QVHNNQRDGMHRQSIPRGRVAYEPNSLGGGCPFQAGMRGFVSFPEPVSEDKVRGKPEKFADHYSQARLFWNSQTPVEKDHIIGGFRFELSRVQVPAVRERVLSLLANVAEELVGGVATGLGMPVPPAQPVLREVSEPEVSESARLSLFARPGEAGVQTLKVALLVCDGVEGEPLRQAYRALATAGAVPRFVGVRLGPAHPDAGAEIPVEISLEAAPSVLWDAVVVPGGEAALALLASLGQVGEFLKDQYRHCKPMLLLGQSAQLLEQWGIPLQLPDGSADPGLVSESAAPKKAKARPGEPLMAAFVSALARRRHFERETDPPRV
ncbi:MAG TPA: catalase-related domain-containing protein, partial [Solimonas sp.]